MINPGRFAASLMFFCNGFGFATWASRIPAVQHDLNLSPFNLGCALLMMGLGAILAMQAVAKLIARYGSNRVSWIACLLSAFALAAIPFAHNLIELGFALFAFGCVTGSMDVAMNANAVAVERGARKSIMASFHALWSFGAMCGASLGSALLHANWSTSHHLNAVAVVLAVLALLSAKWLIKDIAKEDETQQGEPIAADRNAQSDVVTILAFVCFLAFISEGAIADWSALYMARDLKADEAIAALALSVFSITMAVGRLFGDKVIEKFTDVRVLFYGGLLTVIAILCAAAIQHPMVALFGFMLAGIGLSVQVPIAFRLAGHSATHDAGAAIAKVARLGYFGLLAGPPVLGLVAEWWGLRASILSLSLLAVLTSWLALRLKAKRLEVVA